MQKLNHGQVGVTFIKQFINLRSGTGPFSNDKATTLARWPQQSSVLRRFKKSSPL